MPLYQAIILAIVQGLTEFLAGFQHGAFVVGSVDFEVE